MKLAKNPVMAAAKRLKYARLRSERLRKDPRHGWISKLDGWAYLSNACRAIGLRTPTIYRVNPQQRLALVRRPRILHIIPNVWVGGSTQLIVDLHDHLGHRFEMKIITSALPVRGRHQDMDISVVRRSTPQAEVRRLFTSFSPDIVHIHYWGDVDESWYGAFFHTAAELRIPILQNINTPVAPFAVSADGKECFRLADDPGPLRIGRTRPGDPSRDRFDPVLAAEHFRSRFLRCDRHGLSPRA